MQRVSLIHGIVLCLPTLFGCATSKWALDNPVYAEKYDRPYSDDRTEKWWQMGKQMSDARHVRRQSGVYASFGASDFQNDTVLGGELGYLGYSRSWLSGKVGLLGLMHSASDPSGLLGGNVGLQISPPTRLAPYVGAGTFFGGGWRRANDGRNSNGLDDDDDGTIDEADESPIQKANILSAIYPEVGVNYWINGRTRLHAGASYWFNSLGRQNDFWYYSLGLTFSFGADQSDSSFDETRFRSDDELVEHLPQDWRPEDDQQPDANKPDEPVQSSSAIDRKWLPTK